MGRRNSNLLTAALLVGVFSVSATAEAGFVSVADSSSESLLAAGAGASSSVPARSEKNQDPSYLLGRLLDGGFADQSGGMTSSPQTSSAGSNAPPPAALTTTALSAEAQLIQRLGPAGKVWLPPPFSTGVFRPPRFVG